MISAISSVTVRYDFDLVAARRRARQVARGVGFEEQDQTRIATVVSEIARNALRYAGGGRVEFAVDNGDAPALEITVSDNGPGIENVEEILSGRYRSTTGMGMGLIGARRLMDDFAMRSARGKGTTVVLRKNLARHTRHFGKAEVTRLVDQLARQAPEDPVEEMQQQNAELLAALAALNERQVELQRLNQELEDTNRGVLALYAELDEKAESLRRADRLKTSFLSDMSHEFRTPVNSILALSRLLDETPLTDEARKQVFLIRRSADDLAALVNDLLDLAKIEAGKVDVRPAEFDVANLFSALRGMLRPLLLNRSLALVFDDVDNLPPMYSDEAKVSQILRNFISNALKYTEAGEVRVSAEVSAEGDTILFSVADTGVGIAPEDQERIFEEFTQLDTPLQRNTKGTGLGLPLTKKLTALLGGIVRVRSEVGAGSTFTAELPIRYGGAGRKAATMPAMPQRAVPQSKNALKILIIDDDETARYTLGSFATRPGAHVLEAENGLQGIARAQTDRPDVILLDMMMPGLGGHEVLQRLKTDPATRAIPVVIITSRFVNEDERTQILSRAANVIYKGDLSRDVVSDAIDAALAAASDQT
jgi:signal transduction histidine kinase